MWGLLPTAVVFWAALTGLGALGVALALPWALHWGARLAPTVRVRWVIGVLSAPWLMGLAATAVVYGHCIGHNLVGELDDCLTATGRVSSWFCVNRPAPVSALGWALAGALVALLAQRVGAVWAGLRRARRRLRWLGAVADATGRPGVFSVPGAVAFAMAWPEPRVFVGEAVLARLEGPQLQALLAHERAHLARGDLGLRAFARGLAAVHLPGTGAALLGSLALACEQRCDADASLAVADPLVVAESLVDVARLQADPGGDALEARVRALCDAEWSSARAATVLGGFGLASGAVMVLAHVHAIHQAADRVAVWLSARG